MQSQVAERHNRDQTSNAVPVHGHGGVSLDVFAGLAGAFELQQRSTRSGARGSARFDVFETLLSGAFEFVSVDASGLDSRWAWGRPSDELATRPQNGKAVASFEALYGSPIGFEYSKRVSNHNLIFIEKNSWFDEEQPDGSAKESQDGQQAWQFVGVAGDQSRNNGAERDGSGSDNCVSSEAWANDVHVANYPSETNGSHLKCEETK